MKGSYSQIDGWFNGLRKQYDISDRCSTKQAQKRQLICERSFRADFNIIVVSPSAIRDPYSDW